jgi:hypothetical protein
MLNRFLANSIKFQSTCVTNSNKLGFRSSLRELSIWFELLRQIPKDFKFQTIILLLFDRFQTNFLLDKHVKGFRKISERISNILTNSDKFRQIFPI